VLRSIEPGLSGVVPRDLLEKGRSHIVLTSTGQGVTGNQTNQGFCPVIEGIPKSFTHFFEIGLYGGLFLWSQKQGAKHPVDVL